MKLRRLFDNHKLEADFYIYAETAFIHEGDKNYLLKLIDSAKKAKCDGIKFQILLDIEGTYDKDLKIFQKLHEWSFTDDTWLEIIKYAKRKELEVIICLEYFGIIPA